MSLINIRTGLYNIVDGIKTAAGISAVTKYEPPVLAATPATTITLDESSEEYASTSQNWLNGNFLIRTLVERTDDDDTQTTQLITIADAILTAIRDDANQALGCNAVSVIATSISPVQSGLKGNLNVLYIDIRVECRALKSI